MSGTYVIDEFINIKAGDPYRLLPFGIIHHRNKIFDITPEYAAKFKLPNFKPPIKLGSHDNETRAGGHIVALEIREDGIYAIPEYTEEGLKSLERGDYKYHSPEILWEKTGVQDPETGKRINGPMIVGDALLHTPHLGEAVALYSIEVDEKEVEDMSETVSLPKSLYEKFLAQFDKKPEVDPPKLEPTEPKDVIARDDFDALKGERDDLQAQIDQLKTDQDKVDLFNSIKGEFVGEEAEKFGMQYIELGKAEETSERLAGMSEEDREWVLRTFKALSARVDASTLEGEIGSSASGDTNEAGRSNLDVRIQKVMREKDLKYDVALDWLAKEDPDFLKANL